MFSVPWTYSNNLKRSILTYQPCEDFLYLDGDEVQSGCWWDPIHKKVKGENGPLSIVPMNQTYNPSNERWSQDDGYTLVNFDFPQGLSHHPGPGYPLEHNDSKFVDPDLFFESNSDQITQPEVWSDCFGEVSSPFTSPAQTSLSYTPPFLSSPQQNDMLSERYFDFERQNQDSFSEVLTQPSPEQNVQAQEKGDLESSLGTISSSNSLLIKLTDKVLKAEPVQDYELNLLNTIEKCIVKSVTEKKRHNPNKNRDKGLKREEEKQKFFFKSLLKYTETMFFVDAKKSKKTKKRQLDRNSYYEYYWGEVSEKHNIDISNFYHPGKKINVSSQSNTNAQPKLAENRRLKSINTTFIDLVLMSEKFREESIFYLENVFVQENVNSRCKKIGKVLEKIRALVKQTMAKTKNLSQEEKSQKVLKNVQDYIILNNKTKLPWSNAELFETKEFAQGVFKKQPLTKSPF